MESDMQAYSELMDAIRTSSGGNVLRAQAVLQRLIEEHGQLRSAVASEKSENDHLKRQARDYHRTSEYSCLFDLHSSPSPAHDGAWIST